MITFVIAEDISMTIFISYAPNDRAVAEKLHAELKSRGLNPWMADIDLLPGQKKEETIRRTIRQSTYFLAVLSAASFSRRGTVHKEIRLALDLLDEFPDSDVFVIPVRTDDCAIPHERLENLVTVDLFPDDSKGLERLLLALSQMQNHPEHESAEDRGANPLFQESPSPGGMEKQNSHPAPPAGEGRNTEHQDRKPGTEPKAENNSPGVQPLSPVKYAWFSLAAFVLGMILLSVFVNKAADPNVSHRLFYVLLIPLGLCNAAFLFGAMRSYAAYSGKVWGGMLEIGGPAVIAILTVIGGFVLVPDSRPFDMIVFVHGAKGPQDAVLKSKGKVRIDLDGNRRAEPIGENGGAYFSGIPVNFLHQEVLITVDAEGFETAKPGKTVLKPGSIYVEVKPDGRLGKVFGKVKDTEGRPLAGAGLSIGKAQSTSRENGYFEMEIPPEMQKEQQRLSAFLTGFRSWEGTVYPASGQEVGIVLEKE